jgi:hypothetical protein
LIGECRISGALAYLKEYSTNILNYRYVSHSDIYCILIEIGLKENACDKKSRDRKNIFSNSDRLVGHSNLPARACSIPLDRYLTNRTYRENAGTLRTMQTAT